MKKYIDYIIVHGKINKIRDNVDKKYIWFDIDMEVEEKNEHSFFSARISKLFSDRFSLYENMDIIVKGIPKGYLDKRGYRQNFIHVTKINGIELYTKNNSYWNGKIIPESKPWDMNDQEQKELSDWLDR